MNADDLFKLLQSLGIRRLVRRNSNIMGACPSHLENRPSWGISILEPHKHGCFACSFKGNLRNLLEFRGWSQNSINDILGVEPKNALVSKLSFNVKQVAIPNNVVSSQLLWPYLENSSRVIRYMRNRGFGASRICTRYRLRHDSRLNRMVIPWYAPRLVGATGRSLDETDTKIISYGDGFLKGDYFYLPKGSLDKDKPVVLVEGELDAIAIEECSFKNGAGIGQGRFTDRQFSRLETLPVKSVILCFDNDEHGTELNEIVSKKLSGVCPVRMVRYPDAPYFKDPADFFKKQKPKLLKRMLIEASSEESGLSFNVD